MAKRPFTMRIHTSNKVSIYT